MNDQPLPVPDSLAACGRCHFARRARLSLNDLTKQLVCKHSPPQNVFVMTNQGPALAGSGPAVVQENGWCFQFKPAQNLAAIDNESAPEVAPKLLS